MHHAKNLGSNDLEAKGSLGSRQSADLEETRIALIAAARPTATLVSAAAVVNCFSFRSLSISSRDNSTSLISRTVTPQHPRKSPGECHL